MPVTSAVDEALRKVAARTTAAHVRLRRETVERPFGELEWRIIGHARFLTRGRRGPATAMATGVLGYDLKQALRALGPAGLIAALAS